MTKYNPSDAVYIAGRSPELARVDPAENTAGLLNPENPHGWAYIGALSCLGFETEVTYDSKGLPSMQVEGSVKTAIENAQHLARESRHIARQAAGKITGDLDAADNTRLYLNSLLTHLATKQIPYLSTRLPNTLRTLALPFAFEINPDARVLAGRFAPWLLVPAK